MPDRLHSSGDIIAATNTLSKPFPSFSGLFFILEVSCGAPQYRQYASAVSSTKLSSAGGPTILSTDKCSNRVWSNIVSSAVWLVGVSAQPSAKVSAIMLGLDCFGFALIGKSLVMPTSSLSRSFPTASKGAKTRYRGPLLLSPSCCEFFWSFLYRFIRCFLMCDRTSWRRPALNPASAVDPFTNKNLCSTHGCFSATVEASL